MKPLGCAPYPQTRRHPRAAAGRCTHLCTSKRYDSKVDELLLGTDAVDVVVKATVTRAGQIAAATENSIAEPAPSTAEIFPIFKRASNNSFAREVHLRLGAPLGDCFSISDRHNSNNALMMTATTGPLELPGLVATYASTCWTRSESVELARQRWKAVLTG